MDPHISNVRTENGFLKFSLLDCNMSIANALRRIMISDIPTFVFRTYPYSENKAEITHNTTRFHNEIIKQRLSCIPIHIDDMDFPYKDYIIEVDVKNDTDNILYVTTKDFKIKNIKTDVYSEESAVRAIFPPSTITGDYIEFARLQPKLSEMIDGERLTLRCGLDIGMASQDGAFNVISTCSYECTPDIQKANEVWKDKEAVMKKSMVSEAEIEFEKKNWFLLEAKRYYQPNSYDFTIESVGVFENIEIVIKACEIMISKCEKLLENLQHGKVTIIPSETTLKNGFDITLVNEDYTLGKVIEFYLYQQNFIADKTLSFCGFRKPHPHATESIIRVAFHNEIDPVGVSGYVQAASDSAITAFKKLIENMGGDLKKVERVRLSEARDVTSVSKASSKRASSPKKASGADLAQSEAAAVSASSSKSKKSKVPSIKVDLSKVTLPSQQSLTKKQSKGKEPDEEEEGEEGEGEGKGEE
jgi:DNA-directed RNA polymerase subunit L/DNA-directed RNA polymerase alpha subunit